MASKVYYAYDGTEFINSERTEAYANGLSWFRPVYNTYELAEFYGPSAGWESPEADDAPWFDPDEPGSYKFYGAYPLDVTGIESSSRGSTPFENTNDGGNPGRIRHAIKSVVFSVGLIAEDEQGAEYGMRWLRRALLGGLCSKDLTTRIASGRRLDYLAFDPVIDQDYAEDAIDTAHRLERHLYKVTFNSGPTEPVKRAFPCGGQMWMTTFTAVVGNPFEIGYQREIVTIDSGLVASYAPGVDYGSYYGLATYTEEPCASTIFDPIYDPLCPPFIEPPAPPTVPLGCYTVPATWKRLQVGINESLVPDWGQVVPTVQVFSSMVEQRGIRIRFYADEDGNGNVGDDPCNYVGDMLISWMPAGGTLVIDGIQEEISVITNLGQERRADSLVFGTDAKPFSWPSLSCGIAYVMVIDFDDTGGAAPRPEITLSLTPRTV